MILKKVQVGNTKLQLKSVRKKYLITTNNGKMVEYDSYNNAEEHYMILIAEELNDYFDNQNIN